MSVLVEGIAPAIVLSNIYLKVEDIWETKGMGKATINILILSPAEPGLPRQPPRHQAQPPPIPTPLPGEARWAAADVPCVSIHGNEPPSASPCNQGGAFKGVHAGH